MKKKLKCFVCHKEINEEEDYVFKGQTVHKGECLKFMIDEYNAVRNLQIRNKKLCTENEQLKSQLQQKENIIKEVRELLKNDYFEDGSFTNEKKVFELLDKGE